ncbi:MULTISPECIES: GntR family transcriptional regulator [Pectobacterium]|uniref:GntR family transcriptional regulator n=1 Tax=Pectobacterium TaxID=122277 RepID=UPI0018DA542E|nr:MULTISPECIES: GntR family transcriptional regulator [Pectobacterium]QPI45117.1 GntR family transcriptional regulator [Pectobacterium aroidearum]UUE38507.1 GntR family transcriptional regulator [Pectobacterium aroidearum]UUE42881.1 GntR family transcriptional regulator [Pectobacterium aroidearum]UUE47098.1 GntR family transcriptional regulator [Pectobacterium aroidearum]UUE51301.1 GntR family transcriptional regulator [Pectobacterium aroidearum]
MVAKLDTGSALPLYKQLEQKIKSAILDGKFKAGQKIPTELELSQNYQVSRITVRKALESLTRDRLLTRISGKGTFVSAEKFQRDMSGIVSFSELCRSQGRRPGARTIKSVIEMPTTDVRDALELADDDRIITLERIRYADDIPVSLEIARFPETFSFLLTEELNQQSLYQILKEKYDIYFTRSAKVIELVYASYDVAHYLAIPTGYPLISITSRIIDNHGKASCSSTQLIVGDKIRFFV